MRVPLSWIRDFTPIEAEPAEVARALDHLGLEVEAVDEPGREIGGVVVARVVDVVPHPDADKLRLVDVDYGVGSTRVVCGAPNVVPGMLAPYAPSGARLPGGVTLEARRIRGVTSDGMLCSARELALGDDHAGILDLRGHGEASPAEGAGDDPEPGTDVVEVLGLDDTVFDLSITPNRPDAMSVVGVARDLAAHFGLPLDVPAARPDPAGAPTATTISVVVEAPERAPRFTARRLDVSIGPAPRWMARRLALAGMRSISNVVDVTNYVLLERGQPLHAFDLAHLAGRGLVVRRAAPGERITTLDGVERRLEADDLLVCDAERVPQAIAGIMGGADAEVRDTTTEILLEAAYFEPEGISRTSKRLGLRSESSARFERGVDPGGVLDASGRAAQLMQEVAGATVAPDPIDSYPAPVDRPRVTVRTDRVNALLGTDLPADRIPELLAPLEIEVEPDASGPPGRFVARPPTFRPDLEREIDIVEEVARRIGLDSIPRTLPPATRSGTGLSPRQRDRRTVVDALVGAGLAEAVTISLVSSEAVRAAGYAGGVVEAANPLRAEESVLRPLVGPGLLQAAARNAAHGLPDLALFEAGHVFRPPTPATEPLPDERDHVAVVVAGTRRRAPVEPDRPVDVYDAVDCLRVVTDALGLADVRLEPEGAPGFHAGRTAAVVVDGAVAGHVGEYAAATLAAFEMTGPAVGFELDLDALLAGARRDRSFRPLSRFPASAIDLAFVLDDAVAAAAIVGALTEVAGDLAEDVRCFDEFRSDALGPGRRSLAFALRLRAADRTLTDAEVGDVRAACIREVERRFGAELRG